MNWFFLSLLVIVIWGIWGILLKLALKYFIWQQTLILAAIGWSMSYVIFYLLARPPIVLNKYSLLPIVAGIFGMLGAVAFYSALAKGKAAIVIPLTSLYPVITVLLSLLLLKEEITFLQTVGIGLAIIAIFLISLK